MTQVAFVCVENAGRSQMAEAFARRLGREGVTVVSGGTRPASRVHPEMAAAMREVGIDVDGAPPRPITAAEILASDVVVTMGCAADDVCPARFRGDAVDWALPDHAGRSIVEVRQIRDEIERRVNELMGRLSHAR